MILRAFLRLTLLWLLAPLALGQGQVQGELFTRLEGARVEAAIRLQIAPGWHLYHTELGHPEAVGRPTTVELGGAGIRWEPLSWPVPERLPQPEIGPDVYILAHEGTLVLRASGALAAGDARTSADDVTAKLVGLVCAELCIPYQESLSSQGRGPDELFTAVPIAATGAATEAPGAAAPAPAADVVKGGRADTTLHTRRTGDTLTAVLVVRIAPGWHLYHDDLSEASAEAQESGRPTRVTLGGRGVRWGPVHFPAPHRLGQGYDDEAGNEVWLPGHEGEIVLWAEGEVSSGVEPGPIHGEIHGQTCENVCIDYDEVFVDAGRGDDALFAALRAVETPGATVSGATPPSAPAEKEEESLLAFLLLAVGGGLFALLMPCTYPMVPITISFFTKQADKRGGSVLPLALAYGAGIVLIFIAIGVIVGPAVIPFATHPVTNLVIAIVFVVFALALFGVVSLEPPRSLMNVAARASSKGGYLGVFLMGATLVVTSFTCTVPFVGSILAVGGQDGDLTRLVLGMGTFGATMAVPFVLLSLVPGRLRALPKSGEWMNTLKHWLGFVELAAALKFLSNSDLVWRWNVISRELFLVLWALFFALAGLYLLGLFSKRAQRARAGRVRLGGALLSLAFAGYCLFGLRGRELDWVMTAMLPPYSGGRFFPQWYVPDGQWKIVTDDYDRALALARNDDKLLLVNFTGHTCVNCRLMENSVFPSPAVAGILNQSFVEARLHTDGSDNIERILELQRQLTGSVATPIYVLIDPRTGAKEAQFLGSTRDEQAFADFLDGVL